METTFPKEREIPLALLGIGAGLLAIQGLMLAGHHGAMVVLMALSVATGIGVLLNLAGCYITAYLFKISFGELNSAILKLAAIYVFPSAVAGLLGSFGSVAGPLIALGLFMWLFELELTYAIAFGVVMFLVRLVAAGMIFAAIIR